MQSQDFCLHQFQKQVVDLVGSYFRQHPEKLFVPAESTRILDSLSAFFRKEEWNEELIELELTKQIKQSSCFNSPFPSQEELHTPFLQLQSNADGSINQHNKMGMIQLSEQSYNSISIGYGTELFQLSQSSEEGKCSQEIIIEELGLKESDESDLKIGPCIKRAKRGRAARRRFSSISCLSLKEQTEQAGSSFVKQQAICQGSLSEEEEDAGEESLSSETYDHRHKFLKPPKQTRKQSSSWCVWQPSTKTKRIAKHSRISPHSMKGRKPEFPEMELKLIAWIKKMCENGLRTTQADIRKKAMKILERIPEHKNSSFRASKGWMEKFFHRHTEVFSLLSGLSKWRREQAILPELDSPSE